MGALKKWTRAVWMEQNKEGKTIEEEGIIPSVWVELDIKRVRWPSGNVLRAANEMKTPEEKWCSFDLVKIKFTSDSKKECEDYDQTTSVETTDDETVSQTNDKRMPKKKTFPGYLTDPTSSSNSENVEKGTHVLKKAAPPPKTVVQPPPKRVIPPPPCLQKKVVQAPHKPENVPTVSKKPMTSTPLGNERNSRSRSLSFGSWNSNRSPSRESLNGSTLSCSSVNRTRSRSPRRSTRRSPPSHSSGTWHAKSLRSISTRRSPPSRSSGAWHTRSSRSKSTCRSPPSRSSRTGHARSSRNRSTRRSPPSRSSGTSHSRSSRSQSTQRSLPSLSSRTRHARLSRSRSTHRSPPSRSSRTRHARLSRSRSTHRSPPSHSSRTRHARLSRSRSTCRSPPSRSSRSGHARPSRSRSTRRSPPSGSSRTGHARSSRSRSTRRSPPSGSRRTGHARSSRSRSIHRSQNATEQSIPLSTERFQRKLLYIMIEIRDLLRKEQAKVNSACEYPQLDTIEELRRFDETLLVNDEFDKCKRYVIQIGGRDATDHLKKAVQRFLSNQAMSYMNMTGKNEKFGFKETNLFKVIREAVLYSHKTSETVIVDECSKFLKYAPKRAGGIRIPTNN